MKARISQKIKDWDQFRCLASQGFKIRCHTHTHVYLGTAEVWAGLELSMQKLLDQLCQPRTLFTHPFCGRDHIFESSPALGRKAGFVYCVGVDQRFLTPDRSAPDVLPSRI